MPRSEDESPLGGVGAAPIALEHLVVDVRATGVMPAQVAAEVQVELDRAAADGWELQLIQPIIYNSSTTGYLLLIFTRAAPGRA